MQKFKRKITPVIEAIQLHMTNNAEVIKQLRTDGYEVRAYSAPPMRAVTGIQFRTSNGDIICSFGEYLIKGTKGEYYPCPADIFVELYEAINEND